MICFLEAHLVQGGDGGVRLGPVLGGSRNHAVGCLGCIVALLLAVGCLGSWGLAGTGLILSHFDVYSDLYLGSWNLGFRVLV